VVHKRHVGARQWQSGTAICSQAFLRDDNLAQWANDAAAFIRWHLQQRPLGDNQPLALVGISEGAELLATLAEQVPRSKMLVLVGGTGLDPLEALSMQANKVGAPTFVHQLLQRTADTRFANDHLWAGRHMSYWRSMVGWQYSQKLLATPQALWLGFGRFESRAMEQKRSLCVAVFNDADHGLQNRGGDGPLQFYWALVANALDRGDPMTACPTWARR
jgi:hypothetical protein